MLFNEPKLLKFERCACPFRADRGFSALQRAEIAEIVQRASSDISSVRFSALQRAEIAEIVVTVVVPPRPTRFSALQRAEIAEMKRHNTCFSFN